jgi:epoxyqueuosine reductase QueG
MSSEKIFEGIRTHFREAGFNLTVRIKSEVYDEAPGRNRAGDLVAGAKSIILTGFAGRGFWETFSRYLTNNPGFKDNHENLIDDYTRLIFREAAPVLEASCGARYKTVFPFGEGATDLDFVKLGVLGGVGVPSLLGILLNPEYGTWISLRGAIVSDIEFETYDEPIGSFDPCPPCEKPCITACPAHTISDKGWDWESCMRYRLGSDTCSVKCASRLACPYGREHAYKEDQIAHHHKFVLKSAKEFFNYE